MANSLRLFWLYVLHGVLTFSLYGSVFLNAQPLPPPSGPNIQKPQTFLEALTPQFYPGANIVALLLFDNDTLAWETPVQMDYVFALGVAGREAYSACSEKSLSFFGTRDYISRKLCDDEIEFAKTVILCMYYVIYYGFPKQSIGLRNYLTKLKVNPFVNLNNIDTPQGWANYNSRRFMNQYFFKSGWNSLGTQYSGNGKITGIYPRKYVDTTGYKPQNPGHLLPENLRYPLRWQPLTQAVDGFGSYSTQMHITPHIGRTVKPVSMDLASWNALRTKSPYRHPNCYRSISQRDSDNLKNKLIPDMLKEMRTVYEGSEENQKQKRFRSYWWDSKLFSLGIIGVYYEVVAKISPRNMLITGMGESMALYDAVLLAWREKRRHDLARPGTLIRRLFKGRKIADPRGGEINADEWEPLIPTMPHSEFPSASAIMCSSLLTYIKLQVQYRTAGNFTDPGIILNYPPGSLPLPITAGVVVRYGSIEEAIRDCGKSRIWSGLHLLPSVIEGEKIGRVVGQKSFETWRDFEEGRVPKHCHWCLKE